MANVRLDWALPTARTDGSPITPADIARVDIYQDSTGQLPAVGPVAQLGSATTFTLSGVDVGTHTFDVDCVDQQGHISTLSNVASVTIAPSEAAPNAPTGLTATVI